MSGLLLLEWPNIGEKSIKTGDDVNACDLFMKTFGCHVFYNPLFTFPAGF